MIETYHNIHIEIDRDLDPDRRYDINPDRGLDNMTFYNYPNKVFLS